jgi:hypothetical protein
VVVISNSGRTRDLMDACDIARKNGATTIVITATGSPLAAAGHIHLSADHPEGFDRYSPMVSRLLHLMIIDILATCVALRIGGDTVAAASARHEKQPAQQALRLAAGNVSSTVFVVQVLLELSGQLHAAAQIFNNTHTPTAVAVVQQRSSTQCCGAIARHGRIATHARSIGSGD